MPSESQDPRLSVSPEESASPQALVSPESKRKAWLVSGLLSVGLLGLVVAGVSHQTRVAIAPAFAQETTTSQETTTEQETAAPESDPENAEEESDDPESSEPEISDSDESDSEAPESDDPEPDPEAAEALPTEAQTEEPTDQHWQAIARRGTLRVAIDPSVGPIYLFANPETQNYDGFEWDILEAISIHLGINLQPVYVPWGGQLAELQEGRVDLVWGGREPVGLESEAFVPTEPYYLSPQRIVVAAAQDENITSLQNLFGRRAGIVVNSTGAALLEVFNQNRGNAIRLFAGSDPEQLFTRLREGQLDAVVIDQPVAIQAVQATPEDLTLMGLPLLPTPLVGVVQAEHRSVQAQINQAITDLENNGTLAAILERWQL